MPKNIRRFPSVLTETDLQLILETIATSKSYTKSQYAPFLRFRDAAINFLLFYTGMRPKELLHLKWSQIDFEKRLIYIDIYSNKERNDMPVIITKPALDGLITYKKEFEASQVNSEYVFPSIWTNKPIHVDSMGKKMHEIFKETGLPMVKFIASNGNELSSHSLYSYRRSFATKVYNSTKDIFSVQKLLRHVRLTSIPSYVIMNNEHRIKIADDIFK